MLHTESIKKEVADLEWEMFTAVQNQGGRASCQDDSRTFYIMRMSQFTAWPEALLLSYRDDLTKAKRMERNLLSEKYAWMMEDTAPAEFARIADLLPPRSDKKEAMIREIAEVETAWFKAYAQQYPHLSSGNRKAEENRGSLGGTSMSVYLKGELRTYSLKTLTLYLEMIRQLRETGQNMGIMIMDDQMKRQGFAGIDDAEKRLADRSCASYHDMEI